MEKQFITHSPNETMALGRKLASCLNHNSVIGYSGNLGAGKTTFTRGLCDGLGYTGEVSSPTFAIVHEYIGGRIPLYHFDMYRVESVEDLYACGFYDYLGAGALAIEWSENIREALPENTLMVHMAYGEQPDQRIITITGEVDL